MVRALNRTLHGSAKNISNIQFHHIVEQGGNNASRFAANALNSLANVVPTPTNIHHAISGFYKSKPDWVARRGFESVRQYISSHSWEDQYRIGLEVWQHAMKNNGTINIVF